MESKEVVECYYYTNTGSLLLAYKFNAGDCYHLLFEVIDHT